MSDKLSPITLAAAKMLMPNLNFSTTPQKTGLKWIDGKDIYIQSFQFNTPNYGSKQDSGVTLPDRDAVIALFGVLGNTIPINSYVDDKVGCFIDGDALIYLVPNWAKNSDMKVTLLFTMPD